MINKNLDDENKVNRIKKSLVQKAMGPFEHSGEKNKHWIDENIERVQKATH